MQNNPFQIAEIKVSYQPKIKPSERVQITCSEDAVNVFRQIWEYPLELKECFYALFLNRANRVLGYYLVSVGGLSGTVIDIKGILQTALKANASSIILAHNHPSGNSTPSDADKKVTTKAKGASLLLELQILDHVILMREGYYSFADEGLL